MKHPFDNQGRTGILIVSLSCLGLAPYLTAQMPTLDPFELRANPVANPTPVATVESIVSALSYSPWVDVQARNLGELQGDIAIRGGTFEGTGIVLGGMTLYDPQTGHYTVEVPIDPMMLSQPTIALGSSQSQVGLNAATGSIVYDFAPIHNRTYSRLFAGTENLRGASTYLARTWGENGWASDLSYARSESDRNASPIFHSVERVSGRVQYQSEKGRFNILAGYQDKRFAWPFLYALEGLHNIVGSSGIESESIQTTLLVSQYERAFGDAQWSLTTGYRRNVDDYEFDVSNPGLFNPFEHTTEVWSAQSSLKLPLWEGYWTTSLQLMHDSIESTSLVFAPFDTRTYLALVTGWSGEVARHGRVRHLADFGLRFDDTNRDSSALSPYARYTALMERNYGIWKAFVDLSQSTQVPGYTALGSNSNAGLFRGNQDLDREFARTVEVGIHLDGETYKVHSNLFFRHDQDLVDWTYTEGALFARRANNLDVDTWGFEFFAEVDLSWWSWFTARLAYTWMDKNPQFDSVAQAADASFYALNYAVHRATFGADIQLTDSIRFTWDEEYRVQARNALRSGSRHAYLAHVALHADVFKEVTLSVAIDNLFDAQFEEVPGVPGNSRQASLSVALDF